MNFQELKQAVQDPHNKRLALDVLSPTGEKLIKRLIYTPDLESHLDGIAKSGNYPYLIVRFSKKHGNSWLKIFEENYTPKQKTAPMMYSEQNSPTQPAGMNGFGLNDPHSIAKVFTYDELKSDFKALKNKYEELKEKYAELKEKNLLLEMKQNNKPFIDKELLQGAMEILPQLMKGNSAPGLNAPALSPVKSDFFKKIETADDNLVQNLSVILHHIYNTPGFYEKLVELLKKQTNE